MPAAVEKSLHAMMLVAATILLSAAAMEDKWLSAALWTVAGALVVMGLVRRTRLGKR